uniref:Aminotransferase-like plant mobile domain-containing protein n=1 Tax=Fagus sylvatica TaxID=28930 RepID=A0A2N9GSK1_FAGSY
MGKAVYEFLVSGLNRAAASQKAQKTRGNLHIQGCTALLQIWACEHLEIGQKNVEINQPFPRFLAWTHQRMFSKKAMETFSNSANESVVQEAMETLQETHGSSHTTILRNDGARLSNTTQTSSNQWQLELQAERTDREALARHVKRLKDELHRVKGLMATLPIQISIMDLPSSPSKAVKRGKPVKKKAKAAMVDLASSPSKRDNEGKPAVAMVNLVSSPSKGPTSVRASGVDSNEVAFSTETYEITGRDVSSLLGDQAQEESSRWISTAVVDCFKDVLMEKVTESGHPPPYINYIITVHGGRKALEQLCVEKLGHQDVHTWLLEYKNDIPNQDHYA